MRCTSAALLLFLTLAVGSGSAAALKLPPMPAKWPRTLQIGVADSPGGAAALRRTAPFGFRYQYLAGGVNTGGGWSTWNPDGTFASMYVQGATDYKDTRATTQVDVVVGPSYDGVASPQQVSAALSPGAKPSGC